MIYPYLLFPVQFSVTAVALYTILRRNSLPLSRTQVTRWGVFWVILTTAQFWILGPISFNAIQTELDFAVPIHQYVATLSADTRFAHEFAGGMDAYALNQFSGQYLSFERLLVSRLPVWLGLAIYRLVLLSLSVFGTYRLSRTLGSSREGALAIAMLASIAADDLYIHAFWHGTAFAALPLAIYLMVARCGRRHYWLGIAAFGAFHATSCSMPITILNYLFVIPIASWVILGRKAFVALPAMGVLLIFVALNLHEQIYALATISPFTARVRIDGGGGVGAADLFMTMVRGKSPEIIFLVAGGVCAVLYFRVRGFVDDRQIRAAIAVLFYAPLAVAIALIPYRYVGLGVVEAAGWPYLRHGLIVPIVILVATVVSGWNFSDSSRLKNVPAGTIGAAAVGKYAYYLVYCLLIWLSTGGLSYAKLDSLKNPSWLPTEQIRVATIPYRLAENQPAALGYDSAVGITSLQPAATVPYWNAVNSRGYDERVQYTTGPSLYASISEGVAKCCTEYELEKFGIDSVLLRIANVGFLISRLPLAGDGLTKVAGPAEGTILPRDDVPVLRRIIPYLEWIADPYPPYVYALSKPIPRVYAASASMTVLDNTDYKDFIAIVRDRVPNYAVVLRDSDAAQLSSIDGQATIKSFSKTTNGFDVNVGPRSGIVVVNVPYTPFWHARADGKDVPVVAANQIHMAIAVPADTTMLRIRYERPLLREKLSLLFGLEGQD